MDGQGTNGAGGSILKRTRISLNGMLIVVMVLALCFAVAGSYYQQERAIRRAYVHAALKQHTVMRAKLQTLLPGDTPQKAAQLSTEIAKLDNEISLLRSEIGMSPEK